MLVFVSHFSNEMGYYNVVTGGMTGSAEGEGLVGL